MKNHFFLFLFAALLLFVNCTKDMAERDNPFDPGGVNFHGWDEPVLSGPSQGRNFTIAWTDVGASSYVLEEAMNSSFSNAKRYTVHYTSYDFLHVDEGSLYYYRVKTSTGNKDSNWSNTIVVTIISEFEAMGIHMVPIPAGTFRMGDIQGGGNSDERPVHDVTLDSFDMSIYEVTNAQYEKYLTEALASGYITATSSTVAGASGDWSGLVYLDVDDSDCDIDYSGGTFTVRNNHDNNPVIEVTWYGAKSFAEYYGLDLPTEAEWEYACRAGTETKYNTGNSERDLKRAGWYSANDEGWTSAVGQKEPNAWGLYDMHGNVWEWCHDWYDRGYYSSSPSSNPTGAPSGSTRVLRSGSWFSNAGYCRSAIRYYGRPDGTGSYVGFRVVRR